MICFYSKQNDESPLAVASCIVSCGSWTTSSSVACGGEGEERKVTVHSTWEGSVGRFQLVVRVNTIHAANQNLVEGLW